jgi:hypothetical protein
MGGEDDDELLGHQTGYCPDVSTQTLLFLGVQSDVVTPKYVKGTLTLCALTVVPNKNSINTNAKTKSNILFIDFSFVIPR